MWISKELSDSCTTRQPGTLLIPAPHSAALQNNNYNPRTLQQTKNYEELMFYSPKIALKRKFFLFLLSYAKIKRVAGRAGRAAVVYSIPVECF